MRKEVNFKEGAELALTNAAQLFNAAQLSGKDKLYGVGSSLMILSSEESIKALFCLKRHYLPKTTIEDFDKIFKFHDVKHKHIIDKLASMDELLRYVKLIIPLLKSRYKRFCTEDGKPLTNEQDKDFEIVIEHLEFVVNSPIEFSKDDIHNWWLKANNEKNNGFYVGLKNDSWQTPSSVSREFYRMSLSYASKILHYATCFMAINIAYEIFDGFDQVSSLVDNAN